VSEACVKVVSDLKVPDSAVFFLPFGLLWVDYDKLKALRLKTVIKISKKQRIKSESTDSLLTGELMIGGLNDGG